MSFAERKLCSCNTCNVKAAEVSGRRQRKQACLCRSDVAYEQAPEKFCCAKKLETNLFACLRLLWRQNLAMFTTDVNYKVTHTFQFKFLVHRKLNKTRAFDT